MSWEMAWGYVANVPQAYDTNHFSNNNAQDQSPQEDLVYADVTLATKNKKMTMIPNRPTVTTAQPDLNVEYSAINFKLCHEKPDMEQRPITTHGMINNYCAIYYCDNLLSGYSIIACYPHTLL